MSSRALSRGKKLGVGVVYGGRGGGLVSEFAWLERQAMTYQHSAARTGAISSFFIVHYVDQAQLPDVFAAVYDSRVCVGDFKTIDKNSEGQQTIAKRKKRTTPGRKRDKTNVATVCRVANESHLSDIIHSFSR